MKGGKYVYFGTYGCTYNPAMKCQGDKERIPNAISKIMNKVEAQKEFQKQALLQPVDPGETYFLWPKRLCTVRPEDLTAENDLTRCIHVKSQFRSSLKDAGLLIYGDGGDDLKRIRLTYFDYREFFKGLGQLFEGLALLHSKNIVHLDIKPPNLVAKRLADGTFKFHYVDFGFTTAIDSFYKENVPITDYKYWPYDYRFAELGFQMKHITEESVNEWEESNEDFADMEGLESTTEEEQRENFQVYVGYGESQSTRLQRLLKGVDVYSLGIALLEIYNQRVGHILEFDYDDETYKVDVNDVIKNGSNDTRVYNYMILRMISKPFLTLLSKMIDIHLETRITAEKALEEFTAIKGKFDVFHPTVVQRAFKDIELPPVEPSPPAPETPGFSRIQTNLFTGGKKKTQRKRR